MQHQQSSDGADEQREVERSSEDGRRKEPGSRFLGSKKEWISASSRGFSSNPMSTSLVGVGGGAAGVVDSSKRRISASGGDAGSGFELNDIESARTRDSQFLAEDVKDAGALPHHSPVGDPAILWERERLKSGGSMTWELSQRVERDHRERVAGKIDSLRRGYGFAQLDSGRDLSSIDKEFERRVDRYATTREDSHRKGLATSQFIAGRDLSSTGKEMEGRIDRYASSREDSHRRGGAQIDSARESISVDKEMEARVDRYASSRDSHLRDGEHSVKGLSSSTYDWRKRERLSSTAHGSSWSPPFFGSNASQDTSVRFPGVFDMTGGTLSPQVSPYSGSATLVLENIQDDVNHLSPPKRPRLGWGQGLAKYEKKKVGDADDVPKSSAATRGEVLKSESQSEEESPLDRVSISGSWVTSSTFTRALLPEISSDNLQTSTDGVNQKLEPVLFHDQRHANSLQGGSAALPELCVSLSDNSAFKTAMNNGTSGALPLSPSLVSDQVEAPYLSRYLGLTRESDEAARGQSKAANDENSKPSFVSGLADDLSGWSKEAIVLRMEKVEGEIDSVEKELAKLVRETEGDRHEMVVCSPADRGGNSHRVFSPLSEIKVHDTDADDPISVHSLVSLPSPSMADSIMVDSTNDRIADPVVSLSSLEESPVSSGMEQVHNEDLPPLKSSSACSGETDHDTEADVLKEITNGPQSEENRQVVDKDSQLKHKADGSCHSEFESSDLMDHQWRLAYTVFQDNRRLAKEAAAPFSSLLSKDADRPKFYCTPEDSPVWRENVESHLKNQERMQLRLAERRKLLKFKECVLALRYRALKEECQLGQFGMCQRRDRLKAVRRWEVERRNTAAFALTNQRSTFRLRPVMIAPVKVDGAQEEGHLKKKIVAVTPANHLREDLKMPAMIIDERERCFRRFVSRNGLVEDPVSYEQARKTMNPWTVEEKKLFLEKFTAFNKNFSKIASFIEHKTTADCVEYYYRNQKSEDFERIRRRQQLKKRRDYSVSGASYLATTNPGNNRNHRDVNATRVQALTLAAAAAYVASRDCSKALRGSTHKSVDKARPLTTYDSGNLDPLKSVCFKDSRAVSTPDAAVSGISPGSLSTGTPSTSKNCRERQSVKSGSGFVSPTTKGIVFEQHSGSKGMRTTPAHRDTSKADGEEVESQWTDSERQLFTDAVLKYGKEFKSIADHVGSKTQTQCKTFFSKTRKRFKLDELVEQSHETHITDTGLVGTALRTESTCDERVESLMEIPQPSVGEITEFQVNESEASEEKCKLEPEEVNVADGLMLLGQALDAEVSDLPPKMPDSPSIKSFDTATLMVVTEEAEAETVVEVAVEPEPEPEIEVEPKPEQAGADEGQGAGEGVKQEAVLEKSISALSENEQRLSEQQIVKTEDVNEAPVIDNLIKIQNETQQVSGIMCDAEVVDTPTSTREKIDKDIDQPAPLIDIQRGVILAPAEGKNFTSVVVKAEPVVSLDTGGACLTGLLPPVAQAGSVVVTPPLPIIHSGQPRERGARVNTAGEFKPRREPTSWTQEEKEKFAEIIRRHGKDWTLLHESLPAKSLTQIKTYFQNSKAKLGFLSSDSHANLSARGGSTRKRKAEESDTSSNAGSAGQIPNSKMPITSEDVSQKVMASSMMTLSTSVGTSVVGSDSLGYAHFNQSSGQSGEDSSTVRDIQKIIRRMCSGNEFSSQSPIPGGILPLFQPGVASAFPTPNPQQPLLLSTQKPQALVHQPQQQSVSSQAVLQQQQQQQQTSQLITPSQRQLLSQVVQHLQQQAAQHQQQLQQQHQQQLQQQQTSQLVVHQPQQLAHQLQQQVTQMVAAQQQQQHLAQVAKHIQPQLVHHHTQQPLPLSSAVHQQQLVSRPKLTGGQQQPQVSHINRIHHPSSQQQALLLQQQQIIQQQKQHLLLQQLQQEQLSQQLQHQLQSQKQQLQQQPQLQHLQQLQQFQQLQKEQAVLSQHQQQLQQQQLQHAQSLGLLRGPFQSFFADADLLRQSEMIEQRTAASKMSLLPREDLQVQKQRGSGGSQNSQNLAQQQARTTSSSESQRLRLGDVKLFGQSLLSQPPSSTGGQPSTPSSHKPWQPVAPSSTVPVAMPSNTLPKVYGKDPVLLPSAFGRTGGPLLSGEGHAQPWPVASAGNLDLWNSMIGGLQEVVLYKNEEAKPELCSVQDAVAQMTARLSREAHEIDSEDMSTHHTLEHMESRGVQEPQNTEGIGDIVHGSETSELLSESGREHTRMENEWRNESILPMSAGSVGSFTRPVEQVAPALIAQASVNQSCPYAVMNAILALADQRSAQGVVTDELMQQWEVLRRESGNMVDGMSGSGSLGSSAPALGKLQLSGPDISQLIRDGVLIAQPHLMQASLLSNVPKSSWASSLGSHPNEPQLLSSGPSFPQGALLSSHTGLEDSSGPSDSKNQETPSGGSG